MSNLEQVKNQVANQATGGIVSVETLVKNSLKTLGEALPSHMNAERLVRIALTTLRLNPELYKCSPQSFMGALFQSAQLGLEPNIEGQAYIIPFNSSRKVNGEWVKTKEAQFQIGYKGYIELFYRHANAISIDMQEVKEHDQFNYCYGTESFLKHSPAMRNRGEVIGYYAIAKMAHGANIFQYMSVEDCMNHGIKHSKCYDTKTQQFYKNTPWATNPSAMCKKTILIQLMKLLPKSIELQKAVAMDSTMKTDLMPDMSEAKDHTDWTEAEISEPVEKPVEKVEKVLDVVEDKVYNPETCENIQWDDDPLQDDMDPVPPAPVPVPKRLITEPQRKRLLAIAGSKNHSQEQVKEYIKVRYDLDSTQAIPMDQYEEIVKHFEVM